MKKRKLLICVLVAFLLFSCCSCGFYMAKMSSFHCDNENIESIQIIQITKIYSYLNADDPNYGEGDPEYIVLAEVPDSDIEAFVDRINDMDRVVIMFGDPPTFSENSIMIRINRKNGKYDLIHSDVQHFDRSGHSFRSECFSFNIEQYQALISDYYTPEAEEPTN